MTENTYIKNYIFKEYEERLNYLNPFQQYYEDNWKLNLGLYIEIPSEEKPLTRITEGQPFLADLKSSTKCCKLYEDENGNVQINTELSYNKYLEVLDSRVYPKEITRAKVLSFDDKTVTAEIYYDDYEDEGVFEEVFKDSLEEVGLLKCGTLFEIVTERHKGGFSVDVKPADKSLSEEDELLIEEIIKAKNYKC